MPVRQIALITGLGLLLAVAVLRPAGVRTDPLRPPRPAAATALHALVERLSIGPLRPGSRP